MQEISQLSGQFERIRRSIIADIVGVQRKTAESICEDAKTFAPGKGPYKETIKVKDTAVVDGVVSTEIITDFVVKAKSNGNEYNLGYLLENGTLEHAIPNAFGLGSFYGYIDRYGYRHKGTLDKDWHPGFGPLPHFIPALLFHKEDYNKALKRVLDKEFK